MECPATDSKTLFKVFDASRRRKSKKKGYEETRSVATDDSNNAVPHISVGMAVKSPKASLQDMCTVQPPEPGCSKRDRDSSPSITRSPAPETRHRHHRRRQRDGISLALKPGLVSTPRSNTPTQDLGGNTESGMQDQDSLVYAFFEDAIKREKRKHRHRHELRSRERQVSAGCEQEQHRRRRDEQQSREYDKPRKESSPSPTVDQSALFKTFAEFCAQMTKKASPCNETSEVQRTQSHKSLQCEVLRGDSYDIDQRSVRMRSHEHSWENIPSSRLRSQRDVSDSRARGHSPDRDIIVDEHRQRCPYSPRDRGVPRYSSRLDVVGTKSRNIVDERYRDHAPKAVPTRSCIDHNYKPPAPPDRRDYRGFDDRRDPRRNYEGDRRQCFEQKTSRSFDIHREGYADDDRCRRTARSDSNRRCYDEPRDVKRFDDQRSVRDPRYDDRQEKYYDDKPLDTRGRRSNMPSKDRRSVRNLERFEKTSVVSREEYRNRDRSERERDSGLSIADGETSTLSGRSTCLRVVKQEIAEQREAMDKMMKLWKELMRCFKGMQGSQDKTMQDSAANVQESAVAQMRLWRECMRRYETVARDVGDTDARLMEEITKQRSEMAEMSGMWQECLQRYRDMSSDFNTLKEKLKAESPARAPPVAPLVCAEGEGSIPAAGYRLPAPYAQMPPMAACGGYGGGAGGSPLRARASAPPAWWWRAEPPRSPRAPRRRSSPDSRGSRGRERRRHKEQDVSRCKEKSKPSAARSEHRRRKR